MFGFDLSITTDILWNVGFYGAVITSENTDAERSNVAAYLSSLYQ